MCYLEIPNNIAATGILFPSITSRSARKQSKKGFTMSYRSPKDILTAVTQAGLLKARMQMDKTIIMGFLAGAFIGFGGLLSIMIGCGIPGIQANNPGLQKLIFGSVFPVGLILVVLAGSELFTGNTAISIPGVLNREIRWVSWIRNLTLSYAGNLLGSLFVAYFLTYQTHLLSAPPWLTGVQTIAKFKVSQSFWVLSLKGIGCNWLVCLAIWLAVSSDEVSGKIMGIWFPIMAFVALGFEHSIANMFFIPLGIFYGAQVTWFQFFIANLIPVTLGNLVGGSFFVGTIYWYVFMAKRD